MGAPSVDVRSIAASGDGGLGSRTASRAPLGNSLSPRRGWSYRLTLLGERLVAIRQPLKVLHLSLGERHSRSLACIEMAVMPLAPDPHARLYSLPAAATGMIMSAAYVATL